MTYIAEPPLTLGRGHQRTLRAQLRRIVGSFVTMLRYTVTPFNQRPERPDDPPEARAIGDAQLEQCQKVFDQVEASRDFLEAKARASFSVIAFLAPLTASIFVFLLSRSSAGPKTLLFAEIFAGASVLLMILAFISIARAVSVQERIALGLAAIIDFDGRRFRRYNKAYHARGLLYCASVNQAMNAHIAQFVKGAHIFTTIAVLALIVAAVPTGLLLASDRQTTKTELTGPVTVTSTDIAQLRKDVSSVGASLSTIAAGRTDMTKLTVLNALDRIAAELKDIKEALRRQAEFPPQKQSPP